MEKVVVSFIYDEDAKKWETIVTGVINSTEARQAFSAVVLTCQMSDASLLGLTLVSPEGEGYKITPVVYTPPPG